MRDLIIIRGRTISDSDIELIRTLVDKNRDKSRFDISKLLAKEWQWYQPNGRLKDRACRDILAFLERQGLITLPPLQKRGEQIRTENQQLKINFAFNPIAIEGKLNEFLPLSFKMVCQEPLETLWNQLMADHHYLGYSTIVGSHLKYLVYTADGHLVAALAWGSAVWKLKPRDQAIGWTAEQRKQYLHRVANNYRFLILPQVKIPCLASHILSQNIRTLNDDWFQRYNYTLSLLETFVDSGRFNGTCYRAANWVYVGQTKGFAKKGVVFFIMVNPRRCFYIH